MRGELARARTGLRPVRLPLGVALAAAAAAALLPFGAPAGAADRTVLRYPSADLPNVSALQIALFTTDRVTIEFQPGRHVFPTPVFVRGIDGAELRGATGDPRDVVLDFSSAAGVVVEQANRTTLSGLTVRTSAPSGSAIQLIAGLTATVEGFASGTTVERCRLEGSVGIRATNRVRGLTVTRCDLVVTGESGVAGLLWEDGSDLFITRSRFRTVGGASAIAGIVVRRLGTDAEGERARRIFITRNRFDGDFAAGIDLADVVDAGVRDNRLSFPGPVSDSGEGRRGIVLRRLYAASPLAQWDVARNRVRRAHTGLWFLGTDEGLVMGNDLRRCGSESPDTSFGDTGAAIRAEIFSSSCSLSVTGNDCRGLRSPRTQPAIVLSPSGALACALPPPPNRIDRGRPLLGPPTGAAAK